MGKFVVDIQIAVSDNVIIVIYTLNSAVLNRVENYRVDQSAPEFKFFTLV